MREQRTADAPSTTIGTHVEVLEIETATAHEGPRKLWKEDGEADGIVSFACDQYLRGRSQPEELLGEQLWCRRYRVCQPLVLGQSR